MNRISFIFLLFITYSKCKGQDTINKNNKIIITGLKAILNEKKLSGKELKNEIYKVPTAIPYYKKYKLHMGLAYVSAAALVSSLFLYSDREENSLIGPSISIVGGSGVFIFFIISKKQLKKSIEHRNIVTY